MTSRVYKLIVMHPLLPLILHFCIYIRFSKGHIVDLLNASIYSSLLKHDFQSLKLLLCNWLSRGKRKASYGDRLGRRRVTESWDGLEVREEDPISQCVAERGKYWRSSAGPHFTALGGLPLRESIPTAAGASVHITHATPSHTRNTHKPSSRCEYRYNVAAMMKTSHLPSFVSFSSSI